MIDTYVLPGEQIFPEGITEDRDGRTFYVSSSRDGTIFRGQIDNPALNVWQPGGQDGRTSALGMAVDHAGRLLVCGADTGLVVAFDTATGDLIARHTVPAPTLLNDVCVAGPYAYVTDSARPVLWRLSLAGADGADRADGAVGPPLEWLDLTRFGAAADVLHYLNGIVAAPGGQALVVAAQGTGVLWWIDVAARTAAPIDLGGVIVNGDGLVLVGDVLYVCDNSDEPDGSVRYWLTALRLSADGRRGERIGRWERAAADTPTTAAYLDGRLYLVNSQFHARRSGGARAPFTVAALSPPA